MSIRHLQDTNAAHDADVFGDARIGAGVSAFDIPPPKEILAKASGKATANGAGGAVVLQMFRDPEPEPGSEPGPEPGFHDRANRDGALGDEPREGESPYLPDAFWNAWTRLGLIRDGAYQQQRSPDAVFHACLARVAAMALHTLRIPPIVGTDAALCYYCALLSTPGVAKSSTVGVAEGLIPATESLVGPIPLGSGQGIVDVLFEMVPDRDGGKERLVKRHTKHNVFVYADEGDALNALGSSPNSTLRSTLRSVWTGSSVIGDTNATAERRRIVRAGLYTYGVVVAVQAPAAGALLADAATGLPQRFAWALGEHPGVPRAHGKPEAVAPLGWERPNWSHLEVADEIVDEIRADDHARVTGAATVELLDTHAGLLRLKIAILLAYLENRALDVPVGQVTAEHWALAGMVKRASDAARDEARRVSAAHVADADDAAARRRGRQQATTDEAREAHRLTKTVDVARLLAGKVWDQSAEWAGSDLRRSLRSTTRGYYDAALDHATSEEWVEVTDAPGHGESKTTIRRGKRRPT